MGMAILISYPYFILVPALFFFVLFAFRRIPLILVTGILWLLYFPYELAMRYRILCTGECNIRVDLLLIYLILLIASIAALTRYFLTKR